MSDYQEIFRAGLILVSGLVSACAPVGPDFVRPESDANEQWSGYTQEEFLFAPQYSKDHSMTILLISTIIMLVSITSLGIVGLASFAVRQRTKQIGTRRAVGATKADIMRYFLLENWLVTTIGVTLGSVLAIVFNIWLVDTYALDKLDWTYIPIGVVALWILGQLAALMPAIRAASIAPAVATRTV